MHITIFVVLVAVAIVWGVLAVLFEKFRAWRKTVAAGVPVRFVDILCVSGPGIDTDLVVRTYIKLAQAELGVSLEYLRMHHSAGGDIEFVADAMIAAKNRGQDLSFEQAAQTDLARENRDQ